MQIVACAGIAAFVSASASCRRNQSSLTSAAANVSKDEAATKPVDELKKEPGSLPEPDLIRFIAASAKAVSIAKAQNIDIESSREGFGRVSQALRNHQPFIAELKTCGFDWSQWEQIGSSTWSAWSVAQLDYNAEAPLREVAVREAEASRRLAVAQETQRRSVWVLSDIERTRRVEQAKDQQASALQRAEDWARRAADLERQIGEAQNAARQAGATIGNGNAGQSPAPLDPFGPPDDRTVPPDAPPARLREVDRPQAAQAALAFAEERRHELELARQHEADERQRARAAAAVIANPIVPAGPREKAALLADAAKQIQSATAEIEAAQAEQKRVAARLADERRVNRAERRKAASETDIDLLRKHLPEFNAAWGMKVDGTPAP